MLSTWNSTRETGDDSGFTNKTWVRFDEGICHLQFSILFLVGLRMRNPSHGPCQHIFFIADDLRFQIFGRVVLLSSPKKAIFRKDVHVVLWLQTTASNNR